MIGYVTDTGCAPTPEMVEKFNAEIMGMKIYLDKDTYFDGENLTQEEYYNRIEKVSEFTTSPPSVFEIKKKYEEWKKKGYTELVCVHVSSKMSKLIPTCNNACNMVPGLKVHILDSGDVSIGAYFVAEKVFELLQNGKSIAEIEKVLPKIREASFIQVSLSTLKYLVKNKRLGRAEGMIGSMMRVKPILGIDNEGFLKPVAKERTKEKVLETISDNAIQFLSNRQYNIKIYLAWGLEKNRKQVEDLFEMFMKKFELLKFSGYRIIRNRMAPTVSNLAGPETYGFSVYGEEMPID